MPFLTADIIFDGYTFLPFNSVLNISDEGAVMEVFQTDNFDKVRKYNGLLMPGMINAHCHLELSHLKSRIEEKIGMVPFLLSILSMRETVTAEEKQHAIEMAEAEMKANGIVAVGDISNTLDTLQQKAKKNMAYYNFVECLGLRPEKAKDIFMKARDIKEQFVAHHKTSLVLHAPYTISRELIQYIDEDSAGKITSIHNQESAAENELFLTGKGDFLKLFDAVNFDKNDFVTENKNSIQTYLPEFLYQKKIILVHNTFTNQEDIAWTHSLQKEIFWCLCPNANLYIENTLPDIQMMIKNNCNIVLGTDSLSSNHTLSIWDEIRTIKKNILDMPIEMMLKWATSNGARALGMQDVIGSFEPGKQPGVVNITDFSLHDFSPRERNHIQRVI